MNWYTHWLICLKNQKCKEYVLGYDEMWGGDEHDYGGHHGVHAQADQAEPVDHHRRELPIRDDNLLLILLSHPLCQESERDFCRLEICRLQITLVTWVPCRWVWPPGPGSCWRWRPSWWRGSSAEGAGPGGRGRSGSCGRSGRSQAGHPPQVWSSALCLIWAWWRK